MQQGFTEKKKKNSLTNKDVRVASNQLYKPETTSVLHANAVSFCKRATDVQGDSSAFCDITPGSNIQNTRFRLFSDDGRNIPSWTPATHRPQTQAAHSQPHSK